MNMEKSSLPGTGCLIAHVHPSLSLVAEDAEAALLTCSSDVTHGRLTWQEVTSSCTDRRESPEQIECTF